MENSIKNCKDNFCKKYANEKFESSSKFIEQMVKSLKIINTKTLSENKKLELKKTMKTLKDALKNKKNIISKTKESCEILLCNPNCKDTIFQNGEFPKELEKKYSNKKNNLAFLKNTRKKLFDGKKSIIKDSFYIKLNKKNIKEYKEKGALSGCKQSL
jgi:hypothetical protein